MACRQRSRLLSLKIILLPLHQNIASLPNRNQWRRWTFQLGQTGWTRDLRVAFELDALPRQSALSYNGLMNQMDRVVAKFKFDAQLQDTSQVHPQAFISYLMLELTLYQVAGLVRQSRIDLTRGSSPKTRLNRKIQVLRLLPLRFLDRSSQSSGVGKYKAASTLKPAPRCKEGGETTGSVYLKRSIKSVAL